MTAANNPERIPLPGGLYFIKSTEAKDAYHLEGNGKHWLGNVAAEKAKEFAAAMNERSAPSADAVECAEYLREMCTADGVRFDDGCLPVAADIIQQYGDSRADKARDETQLVMRNEREKELVARVAELTARNAELVSALTPFKAKTPCWEGDEKVAIMEDGSFKEIYSDGEHFYLMDTKTTIDRKSIKGWLSRNLLHKAIAIASQGGKGGE